MKMMNELRRRTGAQKSIELRSIIQCNSVELAVDPTQGAQVERIPVTDGVEHLLSPQLGRPSLGRGPDVGQQ